MTKSRADLQRAVLEDLLVIGEGEDPTSSQISRVDARLDPVFAFLAGRGISYIPDPEAIEDEAFLSLVAIVAEFTAPAFGRGRDDTVVEKHCRDLWSIARANKWGEVPRLRVDRGLPLRRFR